MRDVTDSKRMLIQVKEKGPEAVSSSRISILSIDLVRRTFGYMWVIFGRGATSSNSTEEQDMMHEIARAVKLSSQRDSKGPSPA